MQGTNLDVTAGVIKGCIVVCALETPPVVILANPPPERGTAVVFPTSPLFRYMVGIGFACVSIHIPPGPFSLQGTNLEVTAEVAKDC